MKKIVAGLLVAMALGACLPELDTDEGKGKPELTLDFPATTTAGSTETATLTVTNPGPGAMDSIVVAFSRLGDPGLPTPLIDVAPRNEEGTVRTVSPEPRAVSRDGILYTFEGLGVGDSMTISFELVIPVGEGTAGNAILVYDGQDPERARGVRLETEVAG